MPLDQPVRERSSPRRSWTAHSACPHDCPSTCALNIELSDDGHGDVRMGRVHGAKDNSYTAGVICAKVARYAERQHHPDRLLYPLRRKGPKGSKQFERVSWDDALDLIAEKFLAAERTHGPEAVWPYYYAGTMGLVQRDGIHRLRHAKRYSGQYSTICTTLAWTGYIAGTGLLAGPDPREMAKSDCIVIWGTNPVNTQINVMTHAVRARKERNAKIVAVDVYQNGTMAQADLALCLRPGTDGALACAAMHIAFRDGYADRGYLKKYSDHPEELERHLSTRTPEWAASITGLSVAQIEAFGALVGQTKRTYFRLGYGFSRSRNGVTNMHAALSLAVVTGSFQHEGGGAFHNNGAIFHWNKRMIEGTDVADGNVRQLDMSRIGEILTGNAYDLSAYGKKPSAAHMPITAMLIQNVNPVQVAPDQTKVKAGFARDDLFVATHEQFMTVTAELSDIVLPAPMFTEYDDVYQAGGQQHILLGAKVMEPPGECRANHDVICAIAARVGAKHPGFEMSARDHIDWLLTNSGWGNLAELEAKRWIDAQPDFRTAHYLDGFGYADKKFRFSPDWANVPSSRALDFGNASAMPKFPDHWNVTDNATPDRPFRLATSPARNYLNSSFNETPTSLAKEGFPRAKMHPEDLAQLGLADGAAIEMGNAQGVITLAAEAFAGVLRGVVVVESIAPNAQFKDGRGINTLTSADIPAPFGGAAFHDTAVFIRPATTTMQS